MKRVKMVRSGCAATIRSTIGSTRGSQGVSQGEPVSKMFCMSTHRCAQLAVSGPYRSPSLDISLLQGDVPPELLEPGHGVAVGWRAPVAAGGQRAAGAHLRPVRHRRALELAEAEEALEEDLEPVP